MSEMDINQFTISQANAIPTAIAIPLKIWIKKGREVNVREGGCTFEIVSSGARKS